MGQSTQCGQIANLGYDAARDIARVVTAIAFRIVFFIPLDERKKDKVGVLVTELVGLAAIPLLVTPCRHLHNQTTLAGLGRDVISAVVVPTPLKLPVIQRRTAKVVRAQEVNKVN